MSSEKTYHIDMIPMLLLTCFCSHHFIPTIFHLLWVWFFFSFCEGQKDSGLWYSVGREGFFRAFLEQSIWDSCLSWAGSVCFRPVTLINQIIILPSFSTLQFFYLDMLMPRMWWKSGPGDYLRFLTAGCFVPFLPGLLTDTCNQNVCASEKVFLFWCSMFLFLYKV